MMVGANCSAEAPAAGEVRQVCGRPYVPASRYAAKVERLAELRVLVERLRREVAAAGRQRAEAAEAAERICRRLVQAEGETVELRRRVAGLRVQVQEQARRIAEFKALAEKQAAALLDGFERGEGGR